VAATVAISAVVIVWQRAESALQAVELTRDVGLGLTAYPALSRDGKLLAYI
jgi:hypothetical protein